MRLRGSWWVIGVAVVYVLLLEAGIAASFWECSSQEVLYLAGAIIVLLLAQGAMLLVPVQVARERPITRRSLWIPLIGSGLLLGLLVFGAGLALAELFRMRDEWVGWGILLAAGGSWVFWCILFWLIGMRSGPGAVALWLHRWLLAGSALELIIAVTAHIIVRRRNECCATIATGIGIACGIAVALVAFGPAVALLFVARWKKIQAPRGGFEVVNVHPLVPAKSPPKELPKP